MSSDKNRLQELAGIKNKKIYVLIGPPSIGKSTWVKNNLEHLNPYIISRDDIVEGVANSFGFNYDDLFLSPPPESKIGDVNEKFGEVIKTPKEFYNFYGPLSFSKVIEANEMVNKKFNSRMHNASGENVIVVDMTNMSAKSRKNNLRAIKDQENKYEKIAVIFKFKGHEDLIQKVANKRSELSKVAGNSKTISPEILQKMFNSFQDIKPEENFDKIIHADTISNLKNFLNNY